MQFQKMVAIEPIRLLPPWEEQVKQCATESCFYSDIPASNEEIIRRIGDADCVMLSYTSRIEKEVIAACPNIRYIGMCCSLYSPESANVDIRFAKEKGIVVTGVRDYGDVGVKEYVVSELVRLLQGRGGALWKEEPMELTGLAIGVVGMGTLGSLIAQTLHFFDADLYYYSRTRKEEIEQQYDCTYLPLHELLPKVDILITCLNKNVVLLGQSEFDLFGSGKILMNTSIGPSHEIPALKQWLQQKGNYALCDTVAGLGEEIARLPNVFCGTQSAGMTTLAKQRLGDKVLQNLNAFLSTQEKI